MDLSLACSDRTLRVLSLSLIGDSLDTPGVLAIDLAKHIGGYVFNLAMGLHWEEARRCGQGAEGA